MTSKPIKHHGHFSGQMVRVTSRRTFKIAIVVDANIGGKVRISIWQANGAQWTKPILVYRDTLTALAYGVHDKRKRNVIDAAMAKVRDAGGWVHYKDGGTCVGEVSVLT